MNHGYPLNTPQPISAVASWGTATLTQRRHVLEEATRTIRPVEGIGLRVVDAGWVFWEANANAAAAILKATPRDLRPHARALLRQLGSTTTLAAAGVTMYTVLDGDLAECPADTWALAVGLCRIRRGLKPGALRSTDRGILLRRTDRRRPGAATVCRRPPRQARTVAPVLRRPRAHAPPGSVARRDMGGVYPIAPASAKAAPLCPNTSTGPP